MSGPAWAAHVAEFGTPTTADEVSAYAAGLRDAGARGSRARYRRAVRDFIAECDHRAEAIDAALTIAHQECPRPGKSLGASMRSARHSAKARTKAADKARLILARLEGR